MLCIRAAQTGPNSTEPTLRTPCSGARVSAHLAFLGGVLAGSSVGGHRFPGDNHHTAGLERDVWEPSLDVLRGQLGDGGGEVLSVINLAEAVCRVQVRQERCHCPEG